MLFHEIFVLMSYVKISYIWMYVLSMYKAT